MGKKKKALVVPEADLQVAYDGSWYCIAGAGGELSEWTVGYEKLLASEDIGKPTGWFQTTGAAVNAFAERKHGGLLVARDAFQDDLVILLFPLDGLVVGTLAITKILMEDRWFDDVIDNMQVAK